MVRTVTLGAYSPSWCYRIETNVKRKHCLILSYIIAPLVRTIRREVWSQVFGTHLFSSSDASLFKWVSCPVNASLRTCWGVVSMLEQQALSKDFFFHFNVFFVCHVIFKAGCIFFFWKQVLRILILCDSSMLSHLGRQYWLDVKSTRLKIIMPEYSVWLCHFLVVWFWISYLTCLGHNFKVGKTISISWVVTKD